MQFFKKHHTLLFVTLAALLTLPSPAQPPGGTPPPLPVVVARVDQREAFGDPLEALGTALARESVDLKANVTEFAEEILFDDGDRVTKNQILLRMRTDELRADLKSARAVYDERKAAYDRAKELVERQAVSSATLQEREAALRQTEGLIEALQARISDRTLRAPFDGILGIRRISPGALVTAGETLTTLDDLSSLRIEFEAPALCEQQILNAFADIETTLVQYLRQQDITAHLRAAETSSRRAVALGGE